MPRVSQYYRDIAIPGSAALPRTGGSLGIIRPIVNNFMVRNSCPPVI
jgi:hypothetical protein